MRRSRTFVTYSPRPHKRISRASKACPLSIETRTTLTWICDDDLWMAIAEFLDAKSLVNLAATNRRFCAMIMEEMSLWKVICLRDLKVAPPKNPVTHSWKSIYVSAFDGSHSYTFRQVEKHLDWMRIGAFTFDSSVAVITEKLQEVKSSDFQKSGRAFVLNNIKTGIWIADLQLVRCPVCNLKSCEGTMQTLDIRYFELFLYKEYQDEIWDYKEAGSRSFYGNSFAATAGIFDQMHIRTKSTLELVDTKWAAMTGDWEPKVKISSHAVAVYTSLQENEGLHMKCHVLKAGDEGPTLAIRVSQQLI